METQSKNNAFYIIISIVLIHIIAGVLSISFGSSDTYANEHRFYYFILLMLSCLLYLHRTSRPVKNVYEILAFIKNNISNVLIIFVIGLIFQRFPDWDIVLQIGHRSIFTHSVLILWAFYFFTVKKPHIYENNRVRMNCIYLGMVIGVTSHLFIDISYMFLLSPTLFLSAHKGHGYLPLLPSFLEVPFILSMTLISLYHLNHILKKKMNEIRITNVFKVSNIFILNKYEALLLIYLSVNMVLNNLAYDAPSTITFGLWSIIFLVISVIFYKNPFYRSTSDLENPPN